MKKPRPASSANGSNRRSVPKVAENSSVNFGPGKLPHFSLPTQPVDPSEVNWESNSAEGEGIRPPGDNDEYDSPGQATEGLDEEGGSFQGSQVL